MSEPEVSTGLEWSDPNSVLAEMVAYEAEMRRQKYRAEIELQDIRAAEVIRRVLRVNRIGAARA